MVLSSYIRHLGKDIKNRIQNRGATKKSALNRAKSNYHYFYALLHIYTCATKKSAL